MSRSPPRQSSDHPRTRVEPRMEEWGDLRFNEGARRTPPPKKRREGPPGPTWLWWALAAILVVVALWMARQPLSDRLWPESRGQQLRSDAALALKQGRLTAIDGSGARELYTAALALDPDNSDARAGLSRVGQAALTQAHQAMDARRFDEAHRLLDMARDLAVPRAQGDALGKQLREREAATAGIDELLTQASMARTEGHLDGDGSAALPLYQRVLELQPSRTEALEGREDTIADLLQQAQKLLAAGQLAEASALIRRLQSADAGHADLPGALSALVHGIEQTRERAAHALQQGQLEQATAAYRALLAIEAGDAEATRGLGHVASAYAQRSEQLAADFRFADAEAALREARSLAADAPAIAEAQRHLARAKQTQARLEPTSRGGGARKAQLQQLLSEAAAAEARGDLLTPPGDSAYDKLRAARSLAPQDPAVKAAAARLLPAAKQCFEQELRDNRLSRAGACLDARRALEGGDANTRADQRRLAQRWLAVGDERLGAGELNVAQSALGNARALDATTPGLNEFAERLRAAMAAAK